jgi:hypothetical protein
MTDESVIRTSKNRVSREVQRIRDCQHDVNELLKKKREYMPVPCSKRDAMVWCDDCKVWIPFEWVQ